VVKNINKMEEIKNIVGLIDNRLDAIRHFYDELKSKHPDLTDAVAITVSDLAISMYENELLFLTLISRDLKQALNEKEKGTTQV